MAVLDTCKFEYDLTKCEGAILRTNKFFSIICLWENVCRSRADNLAINSTVWSEIDLARELIVFLITCKFEENPIKNETAIFRTTFYPLLVCGGYRLP